MNVYVYVGNNPINFVDPVGLGNGKVVASAQKWKKERERIIKKFGMQSLLNTKKELERQKSEGASHSKLASLSRKLAREREKVFTSVLKKQVDLEGIIERVLGKDSKFKKYAEKASKITMRAAGTKGFYHDRTKKIGLAFQAVDSPEDLLHTTFHENVHAWQFRVDEAAVKDAPWKEYNIPDSRDNVAEVHATTMTLRLMKAMDGSAFRRQIIQETKYHNTELVEYLVKRMVETGRAEVSKWGSVVMSVGGPEASIKELRLSEKAYKGLGYMKRKSLARGRDDPAARWTEGKGGMGWAFKIAYSQMRRESLIEVDDDSIRPKALPLPK